MSNTVRCHTSNENIPEDESFVCEETNETHHGDYLIEMADGSYVCESRADDNATECYHLGGLYRTIDMIRTRSGEYICEEAYENDFFTCDDCGEVYHRDCENYIESQGISVCDECFNNRPRNMPETHRQGLVTTLPQNSTFIPSRVMVVGELRDEAVEDCERHYQDSNNGYDRDFDFSALNKRHDLHIQGEVQSQYSNIRLATMEVLRFLGQQKILGPYKNVVDVNETENTNIAVNLSVLDKFGNLKAREEPADKIIEYAKRSNISGVKHLADKKKESMKKEIFSFSWVISNSNETKTLFPEQKTTTCQSSGVDEHSVGYADFYTNQANAVLFVFENDNRRPIGRALIRMMYDAEWNEYLFFDRFYTTDKLSSDSKIKEKVWEHILNTLIDQGHKVVVSNVSEHGTSNTDFINGFNSGAFKTTPLNKTIRQPGRKHLFEGVAYYSDSGVRTFESYSSTHNHTIYRDKLKANIGFLVEKN